MTRVFCCCIYPAVKATGERFVLYYMNNSKHNAWADTLFRAFSCEEISPLPGCVKQVLSGIGKASIALKTRTLTLVQSFFFECLNRSRRLARDRKCRMKSNRPLQGPLRGWKQTDFFIREQSANKVIGLSFGIITFRKKVIQATAKRYR